MAGSLWPSVGLAKAAKLHKLPVIVTTTARDSMWGPTFPELVDALPGIEIIDRECLRRCACVSRDRDDRPEEADLRRHLTRNLRRFSRDYGGRQGPGRVCGRRCLRNVQPDQARGWPPAN